MSVGIWNPLTPKKGVVSGVPGLGTSVITGGLYRHPSTQWEDETLTSNIKEYKLTPRRQGPVKVHRSKSLAVHRRMGHMGDTEENHSYQGSLVGTCQKEGFCGTRLEPTRRMESKGKESAKKRELCERRDVWDP